MADNNQDNLIEKGLDALISKLKKSASEVDHATFGVQRKIDSIQQKIDTAKKLKDHVQKRNLHGILSIFGGWRYRKIVKILPGVHLNITRHGVSLTLGKSPLSLNIGNHGIYRNERIPGTHLWKRDRIFNEKAQETNLVPKDDIGMHGDALTAGKVRKGRAMKKHAQKKAAGVTPPPLPIKLDPEKIQKFERDKAAILGPKRVLSPEQQANRFLNQQQHQEEMDKKFNLLFNPGVPKNKWDAAIQQGKGQPRRLDTGIQPANDATIRNKVPYVMPKYAGPLASIDQFRDKKNNPTSAIIDLKNEIVKEHKEDHKYDETSAAKAEEKRIKDDEFQASLLDAIAHKRESEKLVPKMVHQNGGHGIIDKGEKVAKAYEEWKIYKALKSFKTPKAPGGPGLIKRMFNVFKGGGAVEEGAGEAAVATGEGAAEGGAKAAGGFVGKLAGPLLAMAVDGVLGMFKSDEWKTSKTSAALGGAFGGTFNNKIINTFASMGKYAMLGAAMGAPFAGVGALAGGIIGAAFGAAMGVIGGENIARFMEQTGIGKLISSELNLGLSGIKFYLKNIVRAFKLMGIGFKFMWQAGKAILKPLMPAIDFATDTVFPILKPLFEHTKDFLDIFSRTFDWLSGILESGKSFDDTLDKLLSDDKLFEHVIEAFKKGLAELAAGLLDKIPFLLDPDGVAHATATLIRREAGIKDSGQTAPGAPVAPPAPPTKETQGPNAGQKVASTIGKSSILNTASKSLLGIDFSNKAPSTPAAPSRTSAVPEAPSTPAAPSRTSAVPEAPSTPAAPSRTSAVPETHKEEPLPKIVPPSTPPDGLNSKDIKYAPGVVPPEIAQLAQETEKETGIPARVTLAQWANESGWGLHSIGNNAFGIQKNSIDKLSQWKTTFEDLTPEGFARFAKQYPKEAKTATQMDGSPLPPTWVGTKRIKVKREFADYKSLKEGFQAHARILQQKNFRPALEKYKKDHNLKEYIKAIGPVYGTGVGNAEALDKLANSKQITKALTPNDMPKAITPTALGATLIPSRPETAGIVPNSPIQRLASPTDGKFLINAEKNIADMKAESSTGSKEPSNIVVAPSSTSVTNTNLVSPQTNPRNTDTTFRDSRFRTGYQT